MTERFHVITGLAVLLTVVFTFGYPETIVESKNYSIA
mgnify:CR=1 FL=1|jgi:hypothetical protein